MKPIEKKLPMIIGHAASTLEVRIHRIRPSLAKELGHKFANMDPWAAYPYPAETIGRYLENFEANAPRYVLLRGEEVLGACGLQLKWLNGPYIQFLGILPEFQNAGVGGLVLNWVDEEALSMSSRNVWVISSDFNADARAFYTRHGFRDVCELSDLVRDGRTEILMRKRI